MNENLPKLKKHIIIKIKYLCRALWGLHAIVPPHPSKGTSSSSSSGTESNKGFFSLSVILKIVYKTTLTVTVFFCSQLTCDTGDHETS